MSFSLKKRQGGVVGRGPPTPTSEQKEILVVDDDEQMHYLLSELFGYCGYHVTCISNVKAALGELKKEKTDLVLLDLCMREADGTAFLASAKNYLPKNESGPPIIVLSVLQDKEIINFTLQCGAMAYVTKPFDPQKLMEKVRGYFSRE